MKLNDTRNVSLTSSLFHSFCYCHQENPDSHKLDVENGSKVLNAFLAKSGYSGKTFIQNLGRVVLLKIYFRLRSFAISSSLSSCCTGKVDSPGFKINGLRIHFFAVLCVLGK